MFETICAVVAGFFAVVIFVYICAEYMPDWMRM